MLIESYAALLLWLSLGCRKRNSQPSILKALLFSLGGGVNIGVMKGGEVQVSTTCGAPVAFFSVPLGD